MFALKSTTFAKSIVAGLVILAAIVIAAFAMNSATAVRNRPAAAPDYQAYSQKAAEPFARIAASQTGNTSDQTRLVELGPVPSKLGPPYWLSFVDKQNGWFADHEKLWRSTDGGSNWRLLFSSKDDTLDLFFTNLQVGWMERVSGTYRTDDGGFIWRKIPTSLEYPKGIISSLHFRNGDTGWVVGARYKPVSLKKMIAESPPGYLAETRDDGSNLILYQRILKTTDSGKVWREQALPDDVGEIFSLKFTDDMHGVALGDNRIFFTRNGGKKWSAAVFDKNCVDANFIKFPDSRPMAVAFAENNLAWVSYDNGRILESSNGGESWCDLLRPEEVWHKGERDAYFSELHFTDSTHGWGLKANGSFYKTEDSGRTWSLVDVDSDGVLNVQFFKDYALLITRVKLLRLAF